MKTKTTPRHRARPTHNGVLRYGVLASACLGTLALTTAAAQAFAGVGVADDGAHTLANPGHREVFSASFDVHQYGEVLAASARNQAEAESIGCSDRSPCRSIALSFQIVTMAGEQVHLNALNLSNAENVHCDGCQTLAGAYQFIVSTPVAFTLSPHVQVQLQHIRDELDALSSSNAPIAQIQADADALAAQVTAVLRAAAAAASTGHAPAAPRSEDPLVTMHRVFHQG
ncbi:hypothetical protein KDL01_15405 [Actinospica durhamensis]|uniref:Uncharacterized protein n=1 Tax=Actinospica durhamensis TaxID=1508375 RepID=A0A941IMV8_9ACTN|nr:hypothetical protein [Actinospica durhamensis]MBR7834660.1 hypothetical protein [Actinospica durhamensis]